MAPSGASVIVLVIFLLTIWTTSAIDDPSVGEIFGALKKIVSFYKSSYKSMNVDGIFGLRMLQGQLQLILNEGKHGHLKPLASSTLVAVGKMEQECLAISELSLPHVLNHDSEYYHNMQALISRPFKSWKKFRKLDFSKRWSPEIFSNGKNMDEPSSDRCLVELLSSTCNPSNKCLDLISSKGMVGYSATHQVLFTILAEQVHCTEPLDNFFNKLDPPKSISSWQNEVCSNIMINMQLKLEKVEHAVPLHYQDLFMEEEIICAMVGFAPEFLHPGFLQQIISWQQSNGCYGSKIEKNEEENYDDSENMNKKIADVYQPQGGQPHPNPEHLTQRSNRSVKMNDKPGLETKKSPYELLHMAHGDTFDGSTKEPRGIVLNKDHIKVGSNQLILKRNRLRRVKPTRQISNKKQVSTANRNVTESSDVKKIPIEETLPKVESEKNTHKRLQRSDEGGDTEDGRGKFLRRLLYEIDLKDGCAAHKTSVAAGVLGVYLHYHLDLIVSKATETTSSPEFGDTENHDENPKDTKYNAGESETDTDGGHDGDETENERDNYPGEKDEYDDDQDLDKAEKHQNIKIPHNRVVIQHHNKPGSQKEDEDPDYRYYDDKEEAEAKSKNKDHNQDRDIQIEDKKTKAKQVQNIHVSPDNMSTTNTIPVSHAILFTAAMFFVIFLMYKFLRRRRVFIRYRTNSRA